MKKTNTKNKTIYLTLALSALMALIFFAIFLYSLNEGDKDTLPVFENKEEAQEENPSVDDSKDVDGQKVYEGAFKETEFTFLSLIPSWEEYGANPEDINFFLRARKGGEWTEWGHVEEAVDANNPNKYYYEEPLFFSGDAYQVKVVFEKGKGEVRDIVIRYIGEDGKNFIDRLKDSPKYLFSTNKARAATTMPAYKKRSDWGCGEPNSSVGWNPDAVRNHGEYTRKLILHHTAASSNYYAAKSANESAWNDPDGVVYSIWYYHTYVRDGGWGDIGYNYLVAPNGTIYQGRYVGVQEHVEPGHARPYNYRNDIDGDGKLEYVNKGISVLGFYQDFYDEGNNLWYDAPKLPSGARSSIEKLTAHFGVRHNINPQNKSIVYSSDASQNVTTYGIEGHGRYAATSCPGNEIYEDLPTIRSNAFRIYGNNLLDFSSFSLSDSNPSLQEEVTASFTITNSNDYSISLDAIGVAGRFIDGGNTATDFGFSATTLAPGQSKSFSFKRAFSNMGEHKALLMYKIDGAWVVPSSVTSKLFEVTIPDIKGTWFLLPNNGTIGASYSPELRLKNNGVGTVTIDSLAIAGRMDGKVYDFAYQNNIGFAAGEEKTITIPAKRLVDTGTYKFSVIMKVGSRWYQVYHTTGAPDIRWMKLEKPDVRVSWFLLPNNGVAGATYNPELKITNHTNQSIALDAVGIAGRMGGKSYDLGYQAVTLGGGETRSISIPSKRLTEPGNYSFIPLMKIGSSWYQIPRTTGASSVRQMDVSVPDIRATSHLSIYPYPAMVNTPVTALVKIKNYSNQATLVDGLVVSGRKSGSNLVYDYSYSSSLNLGSGQEILVDPSRFFTAGGNYSSRPMYRIGNTWYAPKTNGFNIAKEYVVFGETATLEGILMPTTSGKVATEQHLVADLYTTQQISDWDLLFKNCLLNHDNDYYLCGVNGITAIRNTISQTTHYSKSPVTNSLDQNGMAWLTTATNRHKAGSQSLIILGGVYGAFTRPATNNRSEQYYINMRWNYTNIHSQPIYTTNKDWYFEKKVVVTNPVNGKKVVCSILDYGPHPDTNRVAGLSPEAMRALGAVTNSDLRYYWAADQSIPIGPIN